MDVGYKQEVTVGLLVIVGIVIFVAGATWLSGGTLPFFRDEENWWHIRFSDASNLKNSSAVRVSGVTVGKVHKIVFTEPGKVVVSVSLDDKVHPRRGAFAEIVAIGLVGDAAIDLQTGPPENPPLQRSDTIRGLTRAGFTDRAQALSYSADTLLEGLKQLVDSRRQRQLDETLAAMQSALGAAERTMRLYGNPNAGPSAELTRTMASFRALSARLDSTLAHPGLQAALGRSDSLTRSLDRMTSQLAVTTARLDTVLLNVNQGRGTIGKFATDSGLYYDLRDVSAGLKGLLTELQKNPGKIPVTVKIF
jgi:phospholipid/cholesterol/gamma-HCH transport system substrate-binding protein